MAEERAKRELSAILSADVKGYSRLVGEDELAYIQQQETYVKDGEISKYLTHMAL